MDKKNFFIVGSFNSAVAEISCQEHLDQLGEFEYQYKLPEDQTWTCWFDVPSLEEMQEARNPQNVE